MVVTQIHVMTGGIRARLMGESARVTAPQAAEVVAPAKPVAVDEVDEVDRVDSADRGEAVTPEPLQTGSDKKRNGGQK